MRTRARAVALSSFVALGGCGGAVAHHAEAGQSVANVKPFFLTEQPSPNDVIAVRSYCGGLVIKSANKANSELLISPRLAKGLNADQTTLSVSFFSNATSTANPTKVSMAKGQSPLKVNLPTGISEFTIDSLVTGGIDGGTQTSKNSFENICPPVDVSIQPDTGALKITTQNDAPFDNS